MEALPLELLGAKNFPDINIEDIKFDKQSITLIGEIQIDSIIDHTLVEGFSELIFKAKDSVSLVEIWLKAEQDWEQVNSVSPALIFLIEIKQDETIVLKGSDNNQAEFKIVIPHAEIWHQYL